MKSLQLLVMFLIAASSAYCQQAELHINNRSDRSMEIKIMRSEGNGRGSIHSRMTIYPNSNGVKYFSTTGFYFLKIRASRSGRPDVFSKGDPFRVYVGSDGYDVLTITYSIEESSLDTVSGETITKSEFDKDF